jgi:hypothetical protein
MPMNKSKVTKKIYKIKPYPKPSKQILSLAELDIINDAIYKMLRDKMKLKETK